MRILASTCIAAACSVIAGCSAPSPAVAATTVPLSDSGLNAAAPTQTAVQAELEQVENDYDAGKYGDVIRHVAESGILATSPDDVRIESLKLQAFSYCVSGYQQLCTDSFTRILQIDSRFNLKPNELGHPVWGPAFQKAKAAMK